MTSQQAKQIAQAIIKNLKEKVAANANAPKGTAVSTTVLTGKAAVLSKAIQGIGIAALFDTVIGSIPVLKEIYAGLGFANDWVQEHTVGQIPGVGKVLTKIRRTVDGVVAPNSMKYVNDPKWYTNIDMHMAFNIPFNYPDEQLIDIGTGINLASISVMKLKKNPFADKFAIQSRTNQTYDLLKGLRGLSGKLPYSAADLYFYNETADYILCEYARLKMALRLIQFYVMTKTRMPRNVITALGWKYDDFVAHKANYVDLLTQIHNFIHANVPIACWQSVRTMNLFDGLHPDSNDGKVASYYLNDVYHECLIPFDDNGLEEHHFTDFFSEIQEDNSDDLDRPASGTTYDDYVACFINFSNNFLNCEIFGPIRADIIGAFGASAIWKDANISKVCDTKFDDILIKYDELYNTQIQNASILSARIQAINSGFYSPKHAYVNWHTTFNAQNQCEWPDAPDEKDADSDGSFLMQLEYEIQTEESAFKTLIAPPCDGFSGGKYDNELDYNTNQKVDSSYIITNKYNMNEGEQLEILQFHALFDNNSYEVSSDTKLIYTERFVTGMFALVGMTVLYAPSASTDARLDMLRTVDVLDVSSLTNYNEKINQLKASTFWSQLDYAPKLVTFVFPNYGATTSVLHDMNITGSLSRIAFRMAKRYSIYSLYAAGRKVSDGRRINNIVDVYNASK